MNSETQTRSAFTLIEILVVVAVIALLAAIMIPQFTTVKHRNELQSLALSALGKPSAAQVFAAPWLSAEASFDDAYKHIAGALKEAKIDYYGVYGIPDLEGVGTNFFDGFLIMTAPERIDSQGKYGDDRWDIGRKFPPTANLREWLRLFFSNAPEGDYRIFAIAVTNQLPISETKTADWAYMSDLAAQAGNYASLPPELKNVPVGTARVHAYVYTFRREKLEKVPHTTTESHPLHIHFLNAGLSNILAIATP